MYIFICVHALLRCVFFSGRHPITFETMVFMYDSEVYVCLFF